MEILYHLICCISSYRECSEWGENGISIADNRNVNDQVIINGIDIYWAQVEVVQDNWLYNTGMSGMCYISGKYEVETITMSGTGQKV